MMTRDLRTKDMGKSIKVEGVVKETKGVRPRLKVGAFECQRCGSLQDIGQEGQELKKPYMCVSCEGKGPFKLLDLESAFVDYQEIKLKGGEDSDELTIYLEGDLTGEVHEGDRIEVTGILTPKLKKTLVTEMFINANSYNLTN